MQPFKGTCAPKGCEVDHLVALTIGGENSIKNLWPEPFGGPWNAHMKDRLENRLHTLVCDGKMDLKEAQHEISTDWVSAYKKQFGTHGSKPWSKTSMLLIYVCLVVGLCYLVIWVLEQLGIALPPKVV